MEWREALGPAIYGSSNGPKGSLGGCVILRSVVGRRLAKYRAVTVMLPNENLKLPAAGPLIDHCRSKEAPKATQASFDDVYACFVASFLVGCPFSRLKGGIDRVK